MAATATKRTIEAGTEPAVSGLESSPAAVAVKSEWLYFCANPDHPGLSAFNLKDKNHAIERSFLSDQDPLDPDSHAPFCPACKSTVVAYAIDKEGDIPEAIQKAPY